jgi:hypothetical protein
LFARHAGFAGARFKWVTNAACETKALLQPWPGHRTSAGL